MEYIPSLIIKPDLELNSLAASVLWLNTATGSDFTLDSICNQPNITLINQTTESIKIQTVREIKEQLAFSAYQAEKTRYFFFLDAQLLTIPAQNALLKSTEEPPAKTQLIFVTPTPEKLLETIRSRCQIIQLTDPTHNTKNTQKNNDEIRRVFSEIIHSNPGQKITLAANYKERAEALTLCSSLLQFLHAQLRNPHTQYSTKQITHNLKTLLKTMNYLEHNTNVSLAIENCFFELE
ncbi:hypothetical protein KA017_03045 [Candidatus Woesebacteria bacterium]|nr:hypothetical protein [Candidatus Woesebacteria bacterium]